MTQLRISQFLGPYRFLSNFYPASMRFLGHDVPTSEHAYQMCKAMGDKDIEHIATALSPAEAKRRGQLIKVRPDWNEMRLGCMKLVVRNKFTQNGILGSMLVGTGDALLIEGNKWHDKFWGVDLRTGVGENNLGKILMEVRSELNDLRNMPNKETKK